MDWVQYYALALISLSVIGLIKSIVGGDVPMIISTLFIIPIYLRVFNVI